jgi:hypothetical protein
MLPINGKCLFQGLPLSHSAENGVIFTNYSLVLQKINQARAGSYMCESSNQVGKGRSEEIILDVKCEFFFVFAKLLLLNYTKK